jgi:hypothetical protein
MPGYVYAHRGDSVYVNLFVGSAADVPMETGHVRVIQDTRYPWDGDVRLTLTPATPGRFTLRVRVPGWARNEASPGDLYRFADTNAWPVTLMVNERAIPVTLDQGYAVVTRDWESGDRVLLHLPMPVRRVRAADPVAADRGRIALQRGPIVYAAEWPDNPDGHVRNLLLKDDVPLKAEFRPTLLNGVEVITGRAVAYVADSSGHVTSREQPFTAIPYFAWANRGPGEMTVWIPDVETAVRPQPAPTVASTSQVAVSAGRGQRAVNDLAVPSSSYDQSEGFFHWWPHKGTTEWVEYTLLRPTSISQASVYWYDDTGHGEVRVPASWRVLVKDGDVWKPVTASTPYSVEKDRLNTVHFNAVTTSAVRLEVTLQHDWSAGVLEWDVR